jgi:sugar phosphate isomerase/epimerase
MLGAATNEPDPQEGEMEQGLNRRRFLGAAIGTGAAATTAGAWAPTALGNGDRGHDRNDGVPRNRRGIQLYTMRRQIEEGLGTPADVFRALGRFGYTEVETAGHYDLTARELRRQLAREGLRAIAGHDGPDFNFPSGWQDGYRDTVEYAAELGQEFTGFAWFPGPYTEAQFRFLAERFNEAGEIAQEFDLQFFYHNHDFEFLNKQASGAPMFDILLEETDYDLVKFELDLFWITEGGASGVEYLSADPARYIAYHVKDHVWGDRPDEADFEDPGPGMLDFPDLFRAGAGRRLDKHFFVENDSPWLSHPDDDEAEYKTAWNGIEYLRNVRF